MSELFLNMKFNTLDVSMLDLERFEKERMIQLNNVI